MARCTQVTVMRFGKCRTITFGQRSPRNWRSAAVSWPKLRSQWRVCRKYVQSHIYIYIHVCVFVIERLPLFSKVQSLSSDSPKVLVVLDIRWVVLCVMFSPAASIVVARMIQCFGSCTPNIRSGSPGLKC